MDVSSNPAPNEAMHIKGIGKGKHRNCLRAVSGNVMTRKTSSMITGILELTI
jgi:hypothetical protein